MVTVETVLDVVPALSVAVALIYYALNLRNANRTQRLQLETRKAQLYMQLYMRITSEEFMKRSIDLLKWEFDGYEDLSERYLRGPDSSLSAKWFSMLWHIDGLGYMMAQELVEAEMVYNFGGGAAQLQHWRKWEPVIKEMRKNRGDPEFLKWFEYLAEEMMRLRQEKGLEPLPSF
jgi:hypothetical protein